MNATAIQSKKSCVCSACGKTGHRKSNEKFHPIMSKEEYYNTTLVSGIVCKKCGIELPQMLMSEHLDINNPKNKMCGCERILKQKAEMDALLKKHALENLDAELLENDRDERKSQIQEWQKQLVKLARDAGIPEEIYNMDATSDVDELYDLIWAEEDPTHKYRND